ncbi:MAG: hypothetical protein JWP97_1673 [Labilithrix sp.]|nr:hypothetical protein [Labilithrix sp.]
MIEPPCEDCLKARSASGDPKAWCQRHSEHHVHGHVYGYNRELPLDTNDANVIPTGLNQAGKSDPRD